MFKTRLLSGIVLVAAALVTIISGGPVLAGVLAVISMIAFLNYQKQWVFIRKDKRETEWKLQGDAGYFYIMEY